MTPRWSDDDCGIIFAATGQQHLTLARRAARTVRAVMPGLKVDLFTSENLVDPVFDHIHDLNRISHRPKIEAMRRSRFARTLYLDCDVIAVADARDIFSVLDRFDLVGTHENKRNGNIARLKLPGSPANAFPQWNSGVLGLRKSDATDDFLRRWEAAVLDGGRNRDQPTLRNLLFESDLRLLVLPSEYNLMHVSLLLSQGPNCTAPRMIHCPTLHRNGRDPGNPLLPYSLDEALPPAIARRVRQLLATDRSLGATADIATVWHPKGNWLTQFGRRLRRWRVTDEGLD